MTTQTAVESAECVGKKDDQSKRRQAISKTWSEFDSPSHMQVSARSNPLYAPLQPRDDDPICPWSHVYMPTQDVQNAEDDNMSGLSCIRVGQTSNTVAC